MLQPANKTAAEKTSNANKKAFFIATSFSDIFYFQISHPFFDIKTRPHNYA